MAGRNLAPFTARVDDTFVGPMKFGARQVTVEPPGAASKTVLCVDDDGVMLRMLDACLSAYGYTVVTTTDPYKGLELALSLSFDAVVLDYAMPQLDGGEIARELHATKPETPIIFFTGSCSRVPREAAEFSLGVMEKSEGPMALVAALGRIAGTKYAPVRRFRRYRTQIPFTLKIEHHEEVAAVSGVATDLAEGGIGGTVAADLQPGDRVRLEITGPLMETPVCPQAEVRYRKGNTYGFEFVGLNEMQVAILRNSCQKLASA